MDKEFPTLEIEASVVEAAKLLAKQGKGYIIVLEKGKPYGIVTEWDLVSKVLAVEKDPKKVSLRQITSTPLVTIDPDEDLLKASELMHVKGIKRLPVVKGGHLRRDNRHEHRPEVRRVRQQVGQGHPQVVFPDRLTGAVVDLDAPSKEFRF